MATYTTTIKFTTNRALSRREIVNLERQIAAQVDEPWEIMEDDGPDTAYWTRNVRVSTQSATPRRRKA